MGTVVLPAKKTQTTCCLVDIPREKVPYEVVYSCIVVSCTHLIPLVGFPRSLRLSAHNIQSSNSGEATLQGVCKEARGQAR